MGDLKPVTIDELDNGLELGSINTTNKKVGGDSTVVNNKLQTETKNGEEIPKVSFLQLYRYADCMDIILVTIGVLGGIFQGATMPMFALLFGDLLDSFNLEDDSFKDSVRQLCFYMFLLGVGAAVFSYAFSGIFQIAAVRQGARIRKLYLEAILRQDVSWYDMNSSGEFSTRISADTSCIEMGMGEHVGKAIQFVSMFLAGFCIGFVYNWKLTLVLLSVLPLMAAFGAFFMSIVGDLTSGGNDEYSKAGSVAEETFRSFRTVVSFRGEKRALEKYENLLLEVQKKASQSGFVSGLGMGAFHVLMFGSYGLGLWYGSRQVIEDLNDGCSGSEDNLDDRVYECTTGGDVITVFWSVIIGAMAVGQAAPSLTKIAEARGAARKVYDLIERIPPIDSSSPNGKVFEKLRGDIEFANIHFAYPSRLDQPIFSGFNLSIKSGNTVALVGSSGGGKSTTVALLERFYDPLGGTVSIDGEDIRNMNLKWLRQRIGLVSQEPIMFATTIKENIAFGVDGRDVTMEEIEAVSKMANAHHFISEFPDGYDTFVGDKGTQLSGGQKQRIAIARAMLKDPDILLLDEATSALDNESERIVQEALDKLLQMKRRTTIVIAHRLSTVQNADVIAVLNEGRVIEQGNHEELLNVENGLYRQLVKLQETVQQDAGTHYYKLGSTVDLKSLFERQAYGSFAKPSSDAKISAPKKLDSHAKSPSAATLKDDDATEKADVLKPENQHEKDIADNGEAVPMKRLLSLNQDQRGWIFISIIAAAGNGCVTPLMGLFLSEMLVVLYETDVDRVREDSNYWAIMFLLLGVGAFFSQFLGLFTFGHLGATLTRRIRVMAFESVIRQDVGFFDKPENNPGALCARLASDAHKIKAATSEQLNVIVMNITTVALSLGLAFQYSWQMTLIMIAAFPLMALGSASQILLFKDQSDQEGIAKAGKTVTEAVGGIRTVASFTMETRLVELYQDLMKVPTKKKLKVAHAAGMGQAFGQASMFFVYAGVFYFGSLLVIAGSLTFDDMFKSMLLVLFAAFAMGQASTMAGDQGEARIAAKRLFRLIDQKSKIDSLSNAGTQLESKKIAGKIELVDVDFHYPERPDHAVFKKYNLTIEPSQTVALVGTSGGGKSTVISLIERFYDPVNGSVLMDGVDIRSLDIGSLRHNIGLVSQEPTLFACSIADNIAFSCGGVEKVGYDAIVEAAKKANAHDFIMSFPDGYATFVGENGGTQLSGGQKQRIAIARAIIKDPPILLLDEATSALDSESERIVQETLDKLLKAKARTTVVIAHRLSTIKDADKIAVVYDGRIVEEGRFEELMQIEDGHFRRMAIRQESEESK